MLRAFHRRNGPETYAKGNCSVVRP